MLKQTASRVLFVCLLAFCLGLLVGCGSEGSSLPQTYVDQTRYLPECEVDAVEIGYTATDTERFTFGVYCLSSSCDKAYKRGTERRLSDAMWTREIGSLDQIIELAELQDSDYLIRFINMRGVVAEVYKDDFLGTSHRSIPLGNGLSFTAPPNPVTCKKVGLPESIDLATPTKVALNSRIPNTYTFYVGRELSEDQVTWILQSIPAHWLSDVGAGLTPGFFYSAEYPPDFKNSLTTGHLPFKTPIMGVSPNGTETNVFLVYWDAYNEVSHASSYVVFFLK